MPDTNSSRIGFEGEQALSRTSIENTVGSPRRHYAIIVAFVLVVHGLLLLNDGVYWDDWRVYHWLHDKNWSDLAWYFAETRIPGQAQLHWFFGHFPNFVFMYKLAVFLSILLLGLITYKIGCETGFLSRLEALFVALLTLSFPAYQAWVDIGCSQYALCYAAYLLAVYLAFCAEKKRGAAHLVLRAGAIILFFASFMTNSFLVLHVGFLALLMVYSSQRRSMRWQTTLLPVLRSHLDYVLLPLVYWVYKQSVPYNKLSQLTNEMSNYNQPQLLSPKFLVSWVKASLIVFYAQPNEILLAVIHHPLLWALSVFVVIRLYERHLRRGGDFLHSREKSVALLTAGIGLMFLALFPYMLVAKPPLLHGWETRHTLLVSLPMALILLGAARLLFADSQGNLSQPGIACLVTVILGGSLILIDTYIGYEARSIKDRSLVANLHDTPADAPYSVYLTEDKFPLSDEPNYDIYEWAGIFKAAYGDETRIGLDQAHFELRIVYNQLRSLFEISEVPHTGLGHMPRRIQMRQLDLSGPRAALIVQPGREFTTPEETCARYYYFKFLRKSTLPGFLRGITHIEVKPLPHEEKTASTP